VAVIIINWNHGWCLTECIESLLRQEGPEFEILLVDNASADGSVEAVEERFPQVRIFRNPANAGFSRAFNQAVCLTNAPLLLSLNPDVKVQSGFIEELVSAACQDERTGTAVPKLLRADDPGQIDSTGLFVNRRRRPWDRGQGKPDLGQYDAHPAVFGACGGAALYKRAMLEDIREGGAYFDEDFFAYYEDADLAWRAQSRGWGAVYTPRAAASHVRGWGDTLRKGTQAGRGARLALRNRYLMIVKNDSLSSFLLDFLLILAAELPRLAYALFTQPSYWLGLVDFVRAAPAAFQKRRQIFRRRTADPVVLRRWLLVKDLT